MTDSANITDVFEGPETEETETKEVTQEEETEGKESEETTKGDKPSKEDPAPPAEKEPKTVPIAALHDERRKTANLKEEIEKLRQQLPKVEDEMPDPAEDPEGYKKAVKEQLKKEDLEARVNTSTAEMLEKHEDYPEMEKVFLVLCALDKTLYPKMTEQAKPAAFAHETAKAYMEGLREKIREEILAESKGKEPSKDEQRKKSAVEVPNLTRATAQGSNSKDPPKLSDLGEMFEDSPF